MIPLGSGGTHAVPESQSNLVVDNRQLAGQPSRYARDSDDIKDDYIDEVMRNSNGAAAHSSSQSLNTCQQLRLATPRGRQLTRLNKPHSGTNNLHQQQQHRPAMAGVNGGGSLATLANALLRRPTSQPEMELRRTRSFSDAANS